MSADRAYQFVVAQLLEALNMGRSFEDLLTSIYENLKHVVPFNRIGVAILDEVKGSLRAISCRSDGPTHLGRGYSDSLDGSTLQHLLVTGEPRIINDLEGYLALKPQSGSTALIVREGMRSSLTLPLLAEGEPIGVVFFSCRERDVYTDQHIALLKPLAGHMAIALEKTHLMALLQQRNEAYSEIARLKSQLEEQNIYLRDEIKTTHDFGSIVGDSPAIRRVRAAIAQVAGTDSTVLILGETGTGKELVAWAIHELSSRRAQLLVKVNCAALAPSLITSELFGHEAGAFTGATEQRQGRFELAQHGTIFLDEIAEVPAETQVMLLRVLQERAIERVGGSQSIPVDVRVMAATNRDLKSCVDDGQFRADLFYRLNVFPILVPALRERREDIPLLIDHFLRRFAPRMNKNITRVQRRTMELLMHYRWPGNVRELENIVERAMIVSRGEVLEIDAQWLSDEETVGAASRGLPSLAEIERQAILEALQRCGGKVYGAGGAAAMLQLKPTTLYGKMRKHRLARRPGGFEPSGTG